MSYEAFILEKESQKNLLIEIDIRSTHIKWLTYEVNIFQWDITDFAENTTFNFQNGSFGYGSFGNSGITDTGLNIIPVKIGSIIVDTVDYTEVTSLATLRTTDGGYLFDKESQLLLIHFKDDKWPEEFVDQAITLGITSGFVSHIPKMYDGIDYEARIVSAPSFGEAQDPLVYGVLRYDTNSFTLKNNDGAFDDFATKKVFGAQVRMLFGGDDLPYESYTKIMTSTIDDFDLSETEIAINLVDSRKAISKAIPENVFDNTTYTGISDDNRNKQIPLTYGNLRSIPVVCVNEDEPGPPATYTFKIADTTDHAISDIVSVYVNGVEVTPDSENTATATFTILEASNDYTPGDEVTADVIGYVDAGEIIDNPLDIIKDLLLNHTDVIFTSDFFDTTQWQIATNQITSDGTMFIEDSIIIDVIEEICNTVQGNFRIKPDGTYTFKNYNITASVEKSIAKEEIMEPIQITYESDDYVSSAKIKFDKNWLANTYRRELNDEEESSQETIYNRTNRRDFETLLSDRDDAANLGRTIVIRNKDIIPIFTIVTKTQNIGLQLFDTVNFEADRVEKVWYGNVKCEVIGKDVNFDDFTVSLRLRYIQDVSTIPLAEDTEFGIYYGDGYYLDSFYTKGV